MVQRKNKEYKIIIIKKLFKEEKGGKIHTKLANCCILIDTPRAPPLFTHEVAQWRMIALYSSRISVDDMAHLKFSGIVFAHGRIDKSISTMTMN